MSVLEQSESVVEGSTLGLSFTLSGFLPYAFEFQPDMIPYSATEVVYILCVIVFLQSIIILTYKWQTHRLERNQKCDVCDSVMEE